MKPIAYPTRVFFDQRDAINPNGTEHYWWDTCDGILRWLPASIKTHSQALRAAKKARQSERAK